QRAEVMGPLREVGADVRGRDETDAPGPLQDGSPLGVAAVVGRAEQLLHEQAAHAVGDEDQGLLAETLQLQSQQDIIRSVHERQGEAGVKEAASQREAAWREGGVLIAEGPDADVGQVLAEPSGPVLLRLAWWEPVLTGIAVEAVDEDDVAASHPVFAV